MGSGFRVWTAGEVVSASNVNNYLQEQAVMSFAGTAARSSAIASPEEGMLSYLQDSDVYQGYDGSAWVNLGTLSGASDSGLIHINTTTMSAVASQSVNNVFSSTYDNYKIILTGLSSIDADIDFRLRVGGVDNSTASSYVRQDLSAFATSVTGARTTSNAFRAFSWQTSLLNSGIMDIFDPFLVKPTSIQVNTQYASSSAAIQIRAGTHNQSTSYDGFTLISGAGNMTGTITVYGYRK